MCKITDIKTGIKKLDFVAHRGRMTVYLTDGREVIVPLSFFPEIKKLPLKERNNWIILDDQFFTFTTLSKIFSIKDIMTLYFEIDETRMESEIVCGVPNNPRMTVDKERFNPEGKVFEFLLHHG